MLKNYYPEHLFLTKNLVIYYTSLHNARSNFEIFLQLQKLYLKSKIKCFYARTESELLFNHIFIVSVLKVSHRCIRAAIILLHAVIGNV